MHSCKHLYFSSFCLFRECLNLHRSWFVPVVLSSGTWHNMNNACHGTSHFVIIAKTFTFTGFYNWCAYWPIVAAEADCKIYPCTIEFRKFSAVATSNTTTIALWPRLVNLCINEIFIARAFRFCNRFYSENH